RLDRPVPPPALDFRLADVLHGDRRPRGAGMIADRSDRAPRAAGSGTRKIVMLQPLEAGVAVLLKPLSQRRGGGAGAKMPNGRLLPKGMHAGQARGHA